MIRIAIAGCGRILNAHLHGFRKLRERGVSNFRITALIARKEEDAWRFHTRGRGPMPRPPVLPPESNDPLAAPDIYVSDFQDDVEVHVFTDYRQLLDASVTDAVLDTTPAFLHHALGQEVLEAGLHLLTQKPLAMTVRGARRLVDGARRLQLCLGVFENARYRPWARAVRWAFDVGLLGQPQMALLGSLGGPWSPDRLVAGTPWRHELLRAGGGGSIDIGVHQMDLLRYVMGEVATVQALVRSFEPVRRELPGQEPAQVHCTVDDTYFAGVSFVNGAIAELLWSWAGHGKALAIPGAPAFFGTHGCVLNEQLYLDDGFHGDLLDRFEQELKEADRERFFPLGLRDPFAVLQLDWLRGIESGHGPETDGIEGLRDLAAAYAILESARAGRAVALDEVLNGSVDAYQRPIDQHHGLLT
jgi:predicted dehydrogenase